MKKILYFIISLSCFTACGDDFFETEPTDKLSDATYWIADRDFELAVNGLYGYLEGTSQNLTLEMISDNAIRNQNWFSEYEVSTGSGTDSHGFFMSEWTNDYKGIAASNLILEKIQNIEFTDDAKKAQLIGQARFVRAYLHFRLAFLFKDVPLVKQTLTPDEGVQVVKTPQEEIYAYVFSELSEVENGQKLPTQWEDGDYGRITIGAVQALKARFYLYAGDFANAALEADKVMKSGMYQIDTDLAYGDLFSYKGENSNEHILQHQYLIDVHHSGTYGYAPIAVDGGANLSPLRSLYDTYLCTDGLPISESPLYDPVNSGANRDPRMKATLLLPGEMFAGKMFDSMGDDNSPDFRGSGFSATRTGINLRKHLNPEDKSDRKSHNDFAIIRYAEILLTYAEAKLEEGTLDDNVYEAINKLRRRVNMPEVEKNKSVAEMKNIVRMERRVELALEGQRFWDIHRWKIAEDVMNTDVFGLDVEAEGTMKPLYVGSRKFNAQRDYLWPIPRYEIDLNENLLPNNPLY